MNPEDLFLKWLKEECLPSVEDEDTKPFEPIHVPVATPGELAWLDAVIEQVDRENANDGSRPPFIPPDFI